MSWLAPEWISTIDGVVFDRKTRFRYQNWAIGIYVHRYSDGWKARHWTKKGDEILTDIYGREIAYPFLIDAIEAALGTWRN